ncbi:MAG: 30S ribosomal protein S7 [Spirochaetes bacterium]|nr:30S ribosomal protein S7 [Spirochaetota bacterium]NLJ04237.1 30S ribosomal protein S7 [Exilispira sp.]MBP8990844.1 30S ribosomal protein S7 [Spirochaetota bacterium]HOV45581.1 30S ribosomal protein S7 [Exilispira sp.]HPB47648.1 30S ribosomal protein S7 [Exilispira sp.]
MSRKKKRIERELKLDFKYKNQYLTKMINYLMWDGKKSVAQDVIYNAMDLIKEKTNEDPLDVLVKAVDNVKPLVEVRSRRIGGSTYQIPVEVPSYRQFYLACHWIINYARARGGKSMAEKLANEVLDAYRNQGSSIKKKEDTHKMAEANRAFAHLRW